MASLAGVRVVWLNGPFGVGKTAVAAALRDRLPGAVVLDPEWLGAMVRFIVPAPTGDYQDLALWRELVAGAAVATARHAGGPVIVPMSMLNAAYAREILDAVTARGAEVVHVVLHAEREALLRRIDADRDDPGARDWRRAHVDAYENAEWLRRAGTRVDASAPAATVAERVAQLLEQRAARAAGAPWMVAGLDEVAGVPWPGGLTWHPVRMTLGLRAFGAGGYSAARAGEAVVEPHTEAGDGRGHEELYVVLAGCARFTLDGEAVDVPAGRMVFVRDPAVRREAVALEAGTQVLALGGEPGFAPAGSEWMMLARALLPHDRDRAREVLEDGRRELPLSPAVAFGFALLHAAEGRRDDAAAELRDAIAGDERLADEARREPLLADLVT